MDKPFSVKRVPNIGQKLRETDIRFKSGEPEHMFGSAASDPKLSASAADVRRKQALQWLQADDNESNPFPLHRGQSSRGGYITHRMMFRDFCFSVERIFAIEYRLCEDMP